MVRSLLTAEKGLEVAVKEGRGLLQLPLMVSMYSMELKLLFILADPRLSSFWILLVGMRWYHEQQEIWKFFREGERRALRILLSCSCCLNIQHHPSLPPEEYSSNTSSFHVVHLSNAWLGLADSHRRVRRRLVVEPVVNTSRVTLPNLNSSEA